ncbi:hypothetical protein EMCRGX_G010241 [Ephydatia muelleri]
MTQNYIVTAHKSTAVTDAVTGNFTSPEDLNLIEARGNSLLINLVTPEGLKPILDATIYGRVALMQLFRPKNEQKDLLFLMTARYHVSVLSFDPTTSDLVTRASGEMLERVCKPTEGTQIGMIDPDCKMIALHIYTGLLKIIPLDLASGGELKAFNVRLEDLYVIDMKFLHGCATPTIAYLTEEATGRTLKTSGISLREKELVKGPWKPISVETQASLLQPVMPPCGGILIFGYETIIYCSEKVQHSIDPPIIKESIVSCVGMVDRSRYLVGDANGRLLMLFVDSEEKIDGVTQVSSMKLEVLGECSGPSCVCYLDNGVVFVGSAHGDSQLLKLNVTAGPNGSYVEVLDTFTSLAPIIDMSVVDLDKQGHDLIVTCSGFGKDGSLRVVRSGVGINEAASIDLSGVKGVWSLHGGPGSDQLDNMLVVSFVGHTSVLSLKGEEVEETEVPGLVSDQQTYFCGNVAGKNVVQITSTCVRLISEETLELICDWHPPSGRNISTAACNPTQVVVAVGSDLYYLEVKANKLNEVSHAVMRHEVACVDITPVGQRGDKADLCTIGLWTEIAVQVLFLPSLEVVYTQMLGGDIIPRSVLMVSFAGCCYLLCALGDGTLHYFALDPDAGQLSQSKRVVLGTKPITLKAFQSCGATSVFACSNHPTIIHHSHQKLLFSNVNVKEVNYLCSLNSEAFKDR